MQKNIQTIDRINLLKNHLLDISIISVLILSLPGFLILTCNLQNNSFIYIMFCVSSFLYFLIALLSGVLSIEFRFFSIVFIWGSVCIACVYDKLFINDSSQTELIIGCVVLFVFLIYALKKIQKAYYLARDPLEKQHPDISMLGPKENETQYKSGQSACIFQNINKATSEQQEQESILQQSQKMEALETLAGGVAHDFNNLLMPIMGYAEMMLDDFPHDSDVAASLNEILNSTSRAKKLAEQILTFSRRSKMKFEPVDLESIIVETIPHLRTMIPQSIEIKHNIKTNGEKVLGDESQFQQVIMNLCTNASHAIDKEDGFISIALEKQYMEEFIQWNGEHLPSGQYLVLSIEDNGHGIDEKTQARIFDPYFTTKEKGKGTGLGLSMVLGIIKRCNGGISLKSTTGKGTYFYIYLPVVNPSSLCTGMLGK